MQRATVLALVLAMVPLWTAVGQDAEVAKSSGGLVIVCPMEGMIDEGLSVVVERAVAEAQHRNADALVFEIDTFGGRVDSAVDITNHILDAQCMTVAFIQGKGAISAGAIISFACQKIVMEPGTVIGAAQVVAMTPEGMIPMGEKETSFMREKVAALAEHNEHNAAIGKAMVDKDIELRAIPAEGGKWFVYDAATDPDLAEARASEEDAIDEAVDAIMDQVQDQVPVPLDPARDAIKDLVRGVAEPGAEVQAADQEEPEAVGDGSFIILRRGKLLSLSPDDAFKYGLTDGNVNNMGELLSMYELPEAEVVRIEMTWAEKVFRFLTHPTVAGLLLLVGVGGIYLEIKTPGIGLPGIIGVTALLLFFGARAVLGLADVVDLVLVVVGLGLIAVEVLMLPGFGVAGAAGVAALIVGLYLSFTRVTIPQYSWDFDRLRDAGQTMAIASLLFALFVWLTWRLLPKTPVYRWFVLSTAQNVDAGYVVQTEADEEGFVGQTGVAVSNLRPVGRGRFGDKTLMVVSHAEFIDEDTPIVIVQVEGNRYVVDSIRET
jgi:membrane-bound serine protease (ClpP class)